ncbi:MAG: DUF86 domain-containing protein [Burkholderiales bacterium]|nr:DUF86 domain-containing protein [Burkholderiales bacterium]
MEPVFASWQEIRLTENHIKQFRSRPAATRPRPRSCGWRRRRPRRPAARVICSPDPSHGRNHHAPQPQPRRRHPGIPWSAIVGMRNRLVHAYFDIDADVFWTAATKEIPALLPRLQALAASD